MKSGPQHLLQNAGPKFSVLRTKQVDIDAEMVLKATKSASKTIWRALTLVRALFLL